MSLSVTEAAHLLGVHRNTIYNLIKRRQVVAEKTPQGWAISKSSLEALEDVKPSSDRLCLLANAARAIETAMDGFSTAMGLTSTRQLEDHFCICFQMAMMNQALIEMFRKIPGNTKGLPVERLRELQCWHQNLHPDDLELLLALEKDREWCENSRYNYEVRIRNAADIYVWTNIRGILVRPSQHSGILVNVFEMKELF